MKTETTAKARLTITYEQLVMDIEDAVTLAQILNRAEACDKEWVSEISSYKYFIYPRKDNAIEMQLLAQESYALGKMAGKKETKS